jgi:hypothetical protein
MSISGFGGQSHSISNSGMMLFQQGPITSVAGGIELDLISAPIDPGEYTLEINSTMGGVDIFLPHYVQFTIDGGSTFGGRDVHNGVDQWHKIQRKLRKIVPLSDEPPAFALASHDERPVSIRFVLKTTMGGVDIYHL